MHLKFKLKFKFLKNGQTLSKTKQDHLVTLCFSYNFLVNHQSCSIHYLVILFVKIIYNLENLVVGEFATLVSGTNVANLYCMGVLEIDIYF